MKHCLRFLSILASILLIAGTVFAQAFEGTMTMEMSVAQMGTQKISMTVSVKGDKSVSDMQMPSVGAMKMYVDQKAETMTMVMPSMKMGMVTDLKKAAEMAKKNQDTIPPTITATGEKKTINGHNSER